MQAREHKAQTMVLADAGLGLPVRVGRVGGERSYRRRLLELGLVPGTEVCVVRVAPLGDPLELSVRGGSISIRMADARQIRVQAAAAERTVEAAETAPVEPLPSGPQWA